MPVLLTVTASLAAIPAVLVVSSTAFLGEPLLVLVLALVFVFLEPFDLEPLFELSESASPEAPLLLPNLLEAAPAAPTAAAAPAAFVNEPELSSSSDVASAGSVVSETSSVMSSS